MLKELLGEPKRKPRVTAESDREQRGTSGPVMTIKVTSTGRLIHHFIPPAERAKRRSQDRDRGLALKRRRALARRRAAERAEARDLEILRKMWKLGL